MPTPSTQNPHTATTGDADLDAVLAGMGSAPTSAAPSQATVVPGSGQTAPADIPPLTAEAPTAQAGAGLSAIPPLTPAEPASPEPNFAGPATAADLAEQEAQAKAAGVEVFSEPQYQLPTLSGEGEPTLADKAIRYAVTPGIGAITGAFNTYDAGLSAYRFFTGGEPATDADKSDFRRRIEYREKGLQQDLGLPGQLLDGLGQLAPGLLVSGGAGSLLSQVPTIARLGGALGPTLTGAAKVAAASYLSLDPHSGNIANLVDTYAPALSNPVTDALALHPGDSAATGRLKNAVSSLGFDLGLAGVLRGSVALSRALRAGDGEAAAAARKELADAQERLDAQQAAGSPQDGTMGAPGGNVLGAANSAPAAGLGVEGTPAATAQAVPEPSADVVRFYHGSKPGASFGDGLPRFLTPDPVYARDFRSTDGQPNTVHYLDIAKDDPRLAALGGLDETNGIHQNFEASGELADGLRYHSGPLPDGAGFVAQDVHALGDSARSFLDSGEAPPPAPGRAAGEASGGRAQAARAAADEGVSGSPEAPLGTPKGAAPETVFARLPEVTPEIAAEIAASARKDMDALAVHGGDWTAAIQSHEFGQGAGIPWQKLSQPEDVNAFMVRMVDALKPEFDGLKGGDVLTDARVNAMLAQRAQLYNVDPAAMLGRLSAAGTHAAEMAANMEASTLIASRVNHDIAALAARIDAGDLAAYGGDLQAAHADLARRVAVFQTAYGAAQSMKSNAARTLRRMRTEFRVDPEMLNALRDIDPAMLAKTVSSLKGDPAKLAKLGPGLIRRLTDHLGFLQVSNLLSRPETHYVGLMTNTAQMLMRPAERIIGSFALGNAGASVREQAFRQYYFMGASIMDGFRAGARAFLEGDSKIAPHADPVRNLTAAQMDGPVPIPYRQGDGAAANTYNTLMAAVGPKLWQAVSIGPRLLGTVDEMNKAITYRSMVLAKAHMEGAAQVRAAGIEGSEAKQALGEFIRQRMAAAFDEAGYATDQAAIQEAKVATYNQDLLPGTFGKGVQRMVGDVPALRFFLPFVKGPTNVLRYGWKLTPGLNMLQGEFRDAYLGRMGVEAQTQAIGQMGLAQGFLGSAAFLASEGLITGSGPRDSKARQQLMATGWRPYSFVIHAGDKTHYVNFGKYDPVALPFGIVADLYQIAHHPEADDGFMSAVSATLMAVAKSLASKSYLSSAVGALDTFSSDDEGKWSRMGGGLVASLVPFASGQRFVTSTLTDGYLRDARSWADQVMAQTPGLSDKLPPQRNWLGEPVHQAPMLYSSAEPDLVDQEVQRLILETGKDNSRAAVANPSAQAGHADLRKITMVDGRDAYDRYQELAGQPTPESPTLRSVMNDIMGSQGYREAPDGASDVEGTKLHMLAGPKEAYRSAAMKIISADPKVAEALHKAETDVASAYAAKQADPNGTKTQADALNKIVSGLGGGYALSAAQP